MANFVSIEGKWFPRKERAVDMNKPEGEEIYDGDDRDALAILEENDGELGKDFRLSNEELAIRANNVGCANIDEYLKKYHGYNSEKKKAEFEKIRLRKVRGGQNEYSKKQTPLKIVDKHNSGSGLKTQYGSFAETQGSPTVEDAAKTLK